jgi:hypothetical protein
VDAAMKWRFAGIFLLSFAALLIVWWAIDFANLYRRMVLGGAQAVSPVVNGWWLEFEPGATGKAFFRSGPRKLQLLLQMPSLSMGMVPFLSLVLATPGLGPRRLATAVPLGIGLFWLSNVLVVLAYPFIVDRPNAAKETLGVFSGLVAFVVAPLGLWFVLTYPALRPIWQLTRPAELPAARRRPAASP